MNDYVYNEWASTAFLVERICDLEAIAGDELEDDVVRIRAWWWAGAIRAEIDLPA